MKTLFTVMIALLLSTTMFSQTTGYVEFSGGYTTSLPYGSFKIGMEGYNDRVRVQGLYHVTDNFHTFGLQVGYNLRPNLLDNGKRWGFTVNGGVAYTDMNSSKKWMTPKATFVNILLSGSIDFTFVESSKGIGALFVEGFSTMITNGIGVGIRGTIK